MPGENIQDWSTTASTNSNADSAINWVEHMPRADVNNSARGMMAAHAKERNLWNGSIVTTGTVNAQVFSSGKTYTSVPTGLRATLKVGAALTNTATMTLNMDSIGAVTVKDQKGEELEGGEWVAGQYVNILYDGTNWRLLDHAGGLTVNNVTNINNTTVINTSTGPIALVDFTDLDTTLFSRYQIIISNFMPVDDGAAMMINFSTNNGSTFPLDTENYNGVELFASQEQVMALGLFGAMSFQQNSANSLVISWSITLAQPQFTGNIILDLFNFQADISPTVFYANSSYRPEDGAGFSTVSEGRGYQLSMTGCNAVRLWPTSGNIKTATITLVGYAITT